MELKYIATHFSVSLFSGSPSHGARGCSAEACPPGRVRGDPPPAGGGVGGDGEEPPALRDAAGRVPVPVDRRPPGVAADARQRFLHRSPPHAPPPDTGFPPAVAAAAAALPSRRAAAGGELVRRWRCRRGSKPRIMQAEVVLEEGRKRVDVEASRTSAAGGV
ncbi:hypothetical protein Cni_G23175 [Canna indica]|uniref:Uncharacterized protein n=1 Tax=Canna indica TaxID=4628 RepID=A0AAQ3KTG6_9LILI|nr:hypothetical protein Cni_G23175 [Canna indica]